VIEARLSHATVELTEELLQQLADALVDDDRFIALLLDRFGAQIRDQECWLNVAQAAAYRGCPESRIYDLKAQGRLRYKKDGTGPRAPLYFKREWLDESFAPESKA
jgi:hypothetical protein